jgi:hypothetical protein
MRDDTFTARMPNGERVTLRVKRDYEKIADLDPLDQLQATMKMFPPPDDDFERRLRRLRKFEEIFRVGKTVDRDDDGDGDDVVKANRDRDVGHHGLAAAVVEHTLDRLDHLRRKHGFEKADNTKESHNMTGIESLRKSCEAHGISAITEIAKSIVSEQKSFALSEHELVELATTAAQSAYPALTRERAFAKLYESERVLREAVQVAKAMPFVADLTPMLVTGSDTRDLGDESEAIAHLKELGARKWPTASAADQFERALTAPENHKLARRAVPIPKPVTSFPFPR